VKDDGDDVCRVVGGAAESMSFDSARPFRAYRNNDGLALGLEPNVLGTLLYRQFGIVAADEMVRGNAMFLGEDASGHATDVPDWIVELAQGMVPDAKAICTTPMDKPC
jgi:hypothetical protein